MDHASQSDRDAGAYEIPNRFVEVVPDPTGQAYNLSPFLNISQFVVKAAVAGVEMCLKFPVPIPAQEEIDVLAVRFISEKTHMVSIHDIARKIYRILAGRLDDLMFRGLARAGGNQNRRDQNENEEKRKTRSEVNSVPTHRSTVSGSRMDTLQLGIRVTSV